MRKLCPEKASSSVTIGHIVQVYLPCILQTKKRYVGYMYETRDQLKPEYDAKGIETVRYSHKKLQVNTINPKNIIYSKKLEDFERLLQFRSMDNAY